RALHHGRRLRRGDALGDAPGRLLQVHPAPLRRRQAELPDGAPASSLRGRGPEEVTGRGAVLDRDHGPRAVRPFHPEAAMTEPAAMQLPLFDLRDRRALVLGLGGSGAAMARWAARQGAIVRIADSRAQPPGLAGLRANGLDFAVERTDFDAAVLEGADLVAWSPGLSIEKGPSGALYAEAQRRELPVVGELELFSQAICSLPGDAGPPRVLAVTGTNGKTTVTAMAVALCRASGLSARAAGTIGPSLLEALMEAIDPGDLPQVWVVELSCFQ